MPDAVGPRGPGPAGGPRHAAPGDAPVSVRALPRGGSRARHRDRSWRPGRLVRRGLLALGLALGLGVLVVTAALPVDRPAGDGGTTAAPSSATDGPPSAGAVVGGPADWLSAALPPSADLAASAPVRAALTAEGVPADRLRPPEDGVPPGGLLAVLGAAPPGARVVARFDRPGNGDLLVVDPRPARPSTEQQEHRRSLGAALLANPTTGADPAVTAVLRSGEVDLRLLTLLAALAAHEGVGIAAFPTLPGEEGSAAPARRVLLDAAGGAPVPADPAATDRLSAWLAAQRPPFVPDDVQVTADGVLVSYHHVADPDALVSSATG